MAIKKKFIGANTLGAEKIQLENDASLVALNAAGSAEVPLLKLDSSDVLKLLKIPRVDAALPAPSDANDLATKGYVDDILGGGSGNGYAPLGVDGKIPNQYYSSLVITDVFVVADIAARDALSQIEEGDVAKVLDAGAGLPKTYIYGGSSWIEIESGSDVDSVNGYTGNVVLATSDISESGTTNLYYTPTRKAAIEAYADQAEADAIASANAYTDGEVTTLENEDLTFLKLDGSRPMTGDLNLDGFEVTGVSRVATLPGDNLMLSPGSFNMVVEGNVNLGSFQLLFDDGLGQLSTGIGNGSSTSTFSDITPGNSYFSQYQINHNQVQVSTQQEGADLYEQAFMHREMGFKHKVGDNALTTSVSAKVFADQSGAYTGGDAAFIESVNEVTSSQMPLVIKASEMSLESSKIINVADPTSAQDAATKAYVDTTVGAIDLSPYFKHDGSVAMTGNLDVASNVIENVTTIVGAGGALNIEAGTLGSMTLTGSLSTVQIGNNLMVSAASDLSLQAAGQVGISSQTMLANVQGDITIGSASGTSSFNGLNVTVHSFGQMHLAALSGGELAIGTVGGGAFKSISDFSMDTHKITDLVDPTSAQDAATKKYVDDAIVGADLAQYLKHDGSVPMSGDLNLDANDIINVNSMSSVASTNLNITSGNVLGLIASGQVKLDGVSTDFYDSGAYFGKIDMGGGNMYVEANADLHLASNIGVVKVMTELSMEASSIVNLADPTNAQDAATKGYVDGQLDTLSVQQLVHESKTLLPGDLTSISVGFAIQGQPWIQVGRVSLVPGDDYTVSGSTITWAGDVASGGPEALEAGDKISIFYMKAVSPYV